LGSIGWMVSIAKSSSFRSEVSVGVHGTEIFGRSREARRPRQRARRVARRGDRLEVERSLQDRLDGLVADLAEANCPAAGRLEPRIAVAFPETKDSLGRPEPVEGTCGDERRDELPRRLADRVGVGLHFDRDGKKSLELIGRQVIGLRLPLASMEGPSVRRHALVLEIDLESLRGGPEPELLAHETEGGAVEAVVEDDVAIGVELRSLPDRDLVARGGKRPQSRARVLQA